MLKKIFVTAILIFSGAYSGSSQTITYAATQGFCQIGATAVVTQGMKSSTTVQASYPKCLVTVYLTGTTTQPLLYSDKAGTHVLGNPFTATTGAAWLFYSQTGQNIDITLSGGTPTPMPQPFTLTDVPVGSGGSGGGANPAGTIYEINAKLSTSAFQGTGMFTNAPRTAINTFVPYFGQYSINAPTLCPGGRSCGHPLFYTQTAPTINGSGVANGMGQTFFDYRQFFTTARGIFNGYSNNGTFEPVGGGVISMHYDSAVFQTPSISQVFSGNVWDSKPYDAAIMYMYPRGHGGYWAGSDEGFTPFKINGGNLFSNQSGWILSGSPGTGATTINVSTFFNANDVLTYGFVYDFNSSPLISGNVTAYDAANHMLTVTPANVVPPTVNGTTTADMVVTATPGSVNPPTINANGVIQSPVVHVDNGAGFTIDSVNPVIFVCNNDIIEFVIPTTVSTVDPDTNNQTITGTFQKGHPAGCYVFQGGTWGVWDFVADRNGNNWKTSYFAYGAPDSSHLREATFIQGGRGGINPASHNFGGGFNTLNPSSVTGDGTTTKVCGLGIADYSFGNTQVQITGASIPAFNNTYQSSVLDSNYCITFPGTGNGTPTGSVISTGGAVGGANGTGAFNVWATAMVKQMGTTTDASNNVTYNNTVSMFPSSMPWINGHVYNVLDDMQNKTEMLSTVGYYDTAPSSSLNNWVSISAGGQGVTTNSFRMLNIQNTTLWTKYRGGGTGSGQLQGPTLVKVSGPSADTLLMDAPLPRGKSIHIGLNPTSNTGIGNPTFYPFFVDGTGGGGGGMYFSFNPVSGTTVFASGTGNGVATALTFTPSTMVFGATNGFTFQGTPYKFTGLSGAGTQCVNVDSTGVFGRQTCGTVTSVTMTVPAWASVTGSPITSSGTLALTLPAFIASGASHAPGIVPDPGGSAGSTRVLLENATFANIVLKASITLTTSSIPANSCESVHTQTLTGLSSSSFIGPAPNADPSGLVGWGPGSPGLWLDIWPSSNTINYKVCNNSSSPLTPGGAVVANIGAIL